MRCSSALSREEGTVATSRHPSERTCISNRQRLLSLRGADRTSFSPMLFSLVVVLFFLIAHLFWLAPPQGGGTQTTSSTESSDRYIYSLIPIVRMVFAVPTNCNGATISLETTIALNPLEKSYTYSSTGCTYTNSLTISSTSSTRAVESVTLNFVRLKATLLTFSNALMLGKGTTISMDSFSTTNTPSNTFSDLIVSSIFLDGSALNIKNSVLAKQDLTTSISFNGAQMSGAAVSILNSRFDFFYFGIDEAQYERVNLSIWSCIGQRLVFQAWRGLMSQSSISIENTTMAPANAYSYNNNVRLTLFNFAMDRSSLVVNRSVFKTNSEYNAATIGDGWMALTLSQVIILSSIFEGMNPLYMCSGPALEDGSLLLIQNTTFTSTSPSASLPNSGDGVCISSRGMVNYEASNRITRGAMYVSRNGWEFQSGWFVHVHQSKLTKFTFEGQLSEGSVQIANSTFIGAISMGASTMENAKVLIEAASATSLTYYAWSAFAKNSSWIIRDSTFTGATAVFIAPQWQDGSVLVIDNCTFNFAYDSGFAVTIGGQVWGTSSNSLLSPFKPAITHKITRNRFLQTVTFGTTPTLLYYSPAIGSSLDVVVSENVFSAARSSARLAHLQVSDGRLLFDRSNTCDSIGELLVSVQGKGNISVLVHHFPRLTALTITKGLSLYSTAKVLVIVTNSTITNSLSVSLSSVKDLQVAVIDSTVGESVAYSWRLCDSVCDVKMERTRVKFGGGSQINAENNNFGYPTTIDLFSPLISTSLLTTNFVIAGPDATFSIVDCAFGGVLTLNPSLEDRAQLIIVRSRVLGGLEVGGTVSFGGRFMVSENVIGGVGSSVNGTLRQSMVGPQFEMYVDLDQLSVLSSFSSSSPPPMLSPLTVRNLQLDSNGTLVISNNVVMSQIVFKGTSSSFSSSSQSFADLTSLMELIAAEDGLGVAWVPPKLVSPKLPSNSSNTSNNNSTDSEKQYASLTNAVFRTPTFLSALKVKQSTLGADSSVLLNGNYFYALTRVEEVLLGQDDGSQNNNVGGVGNDVDNNNSNSTTTSTENIIIGGGVDSLLDKVFRLPSLRSPRWTRSGVCDVQCDANGPQIASINAPLLSLVSHVCCLRSAAIDIVPSTTIASSTAGILLHGNVLEVGTADDFTLRLNTVNGVMDDGNGAVDSQSGGGGTIDLGGGGMSANAFVKGHLAVLARVDYSPSQLSVTADRSLTTAGLIGPSTFRFTYQNNNDALGPHLFENASTSEPFPSTGALYDGSASYVTSLLRSNRGNTTTVDDAPRLTLVVIKRERAETSTVNEPVPVETSATPNAGSTANSLPSAYSSPFYFPSSVSNCISSEARPPTAMGLLASLKSITGKSKGGADVNTTETSPATDVVMVVGTTIDVSIVEATLQSLTIFIGEEETPQLLFDDAAFFNLTDVGSIMANNTSLLCGAIPQANETASAHNASYSAEAVCKAAVSFVGVAVSVRSCTFLGSVSFTLHDSERLSSLATFSSASPIPTTTTDLPSSSGANEDWCESTSGGGTTDEGQCKLSTRNDARVVVVDIAENTFLAEFASLHAFEVAAASTSGQGLGLGGAEEEEITTATSTTNSSTSLNTTSTSTSSTNDPSATDKEPLQQMPAAQHISFFSSLSSLLDKEDSLLNIRLSTRGMAMPLAPPNTTFVQKVSPTVVVVHNNTFTLRLRRVVGIAAAPIPPMSNNTGTATASTETTQSSTTVSSNTTATSNSTKNASDDHILAVAIDLDSYLNASDDKKGSLFSKGAVSLSVQSFLLSSYYSPLSPCSVSNCSFNGTDNDGANKRRAPAYDVFATAVGVEGNAFRFEVEKILVWSGEKKWSSNASVAFLNDPINNSGSSSGTAAAGGNNNNNSTNNSSSIVPPQASMEEESELILPTLFGIRLLSLLTNNEGGPSSSSLGATAAQAGKALLMSVSENNISSVTTKTKLVAKVTTMEEAASSNDTNFSHTSPFCCSSSVAHQPSVSSTRGGDCFLPHLVVPILFDLSSSSSSDEKNTTAATTTAVIAISRNSHVANSKTSTAGGGERGGSTCRGSDHDAEDTPFFTADMYHHTYVKEREEEEQTKALLGATPSRALAALAYATVGNLFFIKATTPPLAPTLAATAAGKSRSSSSLLLDYQGSLYIEDNLARLGGISITFAPNSSINRVVLSSNRVGFYDFMVHAHNHEAITTMGSEEQPMTTAEGMFLPSDNNMNAINSTTTASSNRRYYKQQQQQQLETATTSTSTTTTTVSITTVIDTAYSPSVTTIGGGEQQQQQQYLWIDRCNYVVRSDFDNTEALSRKTRDDARPVRISIFPAVGGGEVRTRGSGAALAFTYEACYTYTASVEPTITVTPSLEGSVSETETHTKELSATQTLTQSVSPSDALEPSATQTQGKEESATMSAAVSGETPTHSHASSLNSETRTQSASGNNNGDGDGGASQSPTRHVSRSTSLTLGAETTVSLLTQTSSLSEVVDANRSVSRSSTSQRTRTATLSATATAALISTQSITPLITPSQSLEETTVLSTDHHHSSEDGTTTDDYTLTSDETVSNTNVSTLSTLSTAAGEENSTTDDEWQTINGTTTPTTITITGTATTSSSSANTTTIITTSGSEDEGVVNSTNGTCSSTPMPTDISSANESSSAPMLTTSEGDNNGGGKKESNSLTRTVSLSLSTHDTTLSVSRSVSEVARPVSKDPERNDGISGVIAAVGAVWSFVVVGGTSAEFHAMVIILDGYCSSDTDRSRISIVRHILAPFTALSRGWAVLGNIIITAVVGLAQGLMMLYRLGGVKKLRISRAFLARHKMKKTNKNTNKAFSGDENRVVDSETAMAQRSATDERRKIAEAEGKRSQEVLRAMQLSCFPAFTMTAASLLYPGVCFNVFFMLREYKTFLVSADRGSLGGGAGGSFLNSQPIEDYIYLGATGDVGDTTTNLVAVVLGLLFIIGWPLAVYICVRSLHGNEEFTRYDYGYNSADCKPKRTCKKARQSAAVRTYSEGGDENEERNSNGEPTQHASRVKSCLYRMLLPRGYYGHRPRRMYGPAMTFVRPRRRYWALWPWALTLVVAAIVNAPTTLSVSGLDLYLDSEGERAATHHRPHCRFLHVWLMLLFVISAVFIAASRAHRSNVSTILTVISLTSLAIFSSTYVVTNEYDKHSDGVVSVLGSQQQLMALVDSPTIIVSSLSQQKQQEGTLPFSTAITAQIAAGLPFGNDRVEQEVLPLVNTLTSSPTTHSSELGVTTPSNSSSSSPVTNTSAPPSSGIGKPSSSEETNDNPLGLSAMGVVCGASLLQLIYAVAVAIVEANRRTKKPSTQVSQRRSLQLVANDVEEGDGGVDDEAREYASRQPCHESHLFEESEEQSSGELPRRGDERRSIASSRSNGGAKSMVPRARESAEKSDARCPTSGSDVDIRRRANSAEYSDAEGKQSENEIVNPLESHRDQENRKVYSAVAAADASQLYNSSMYRSAFAVSSFVRK